MHNSQITKVGLENVLELQKLAQETFIESFGDYNTEADIKKYLQTNLSIEHLSIEIKNTSSYFYLVHNDKNPIAYLKLNTDTAQTENKGSEYIEVERIYILKEFKQKGLGKELMRFAENMGRKLHKKIIWLGVWEQNTDAINFYTKMGFKQHGEHIFVLGEDKQTDLIFEKKINTNI